MGLTQRDLDIISECPLNDALDSFREKLPDFNQADAPRQEDIVSLLGALVASRAAFSLASPDGSGSVAIRLLSVLHQVRGGLVPFEKFLPLVCHIVDKSPDDAIWTATFDIVDSVGPLTPPLPSAASTFRGAPVKSSSGRLADSETREIVERELFFEIKDCTFRSVGSFCDRFFNPQRWSNEQRRMLQDMMSAHDGKKWEGFPSVANEGPIWDWLSSLQERVLPNAPHRLHTTQTANQFKERKGQMDIFFQTSTNVGNIFQYKDILVVGEQKKSYDTGRFKADFLQLTRHVRGIFADQPTRRFVHAFLLCASMMELWVFDRSGPYSSGPFNIHDQPDQFARALVGYATMDDDAMGLDTFVERKDGHRYITLGETSRIRLGSPIVRQNAVVCRGTTCYATRNGCVAKFSWVSDKRKLEVEHLKLAEERGVVGVAKVVAHCRITAIGELREGLEFPQRHRFRSEDAYFEDLPSTSSASSGQKRKPSAKYISDDASGSKKRRSNSPSSGRLQKASSRHSMNRSKPSLYTTDEDLWENRIYSCLVVSPAGRVLGDFETTRELLEAMRDAIKAHQSLYTTGGILHRDISSNNIIITRPEAADGFSGMLIDLDLAKVRDSGPSGARHQTGTVQFMAVEVLRRVDHTYRHDLESFFYVLLWLCARQSWNRGFAREGEMTPKESLLRKWEIGRFQDIADAKEGHMTVNSLERIMGEFPEALHVVKSLCSRLRRILFPLDKDERMSFGTPTGDPDQLYQPIIEAYDNIISRL